MDDLPTADLYQPLTLTEVTQATIVATALFFAGYGVVKLVRHLQREKPLKEYHNGEHPNTITIFES